MLPILRGAGSNQTSERQTDPFGAGQPAPVQTADKFMLNTSSAVGFQPSNRGTICSSA